MASTATTPSPSTIAPTQSPWYDRFLLFNLVCEVGIIVTGGLVRVTGSGLGCPTWPQCVPGSFTPVAHQAQGWHKAIEFGNRTLTGVLVVAAVLAAYAVWRWHPTRSLKRAALVVLLGVPLQAVIGGLSVLAALHPVSVSLHFLASAVIVAASAYLYVARHEGDGPRVPSVPAPVLRVAQVTTAVGAVVLTLGTVVTGAGPNSGDATSASRLAVDPRAVSWLHADAVMLFTGLVVATWLAARLTGTTERSRTAWTGVLHITIAQAALGYLQYVLKIPGGLVVLHMLLAALLVVMLTKGLLGLRERTP